SSSDKLMSEINGGTALKPLSSGGKSSASAGSAGVSITLFAAPLPLLSRYPNQIEPHKSFNHNTPPPNPETLFRSCEGRSSSTICCSAPKSISCECVRLSRFHTCSLWPYFPPSSSSGFTPSFTMFGVPHSEVTIASCPRCHQKSYARCCGPRSRSHFPLSSNVSASIRKIPPGPSPLAEPSALP